MKKNGIVLITTLFITAFLIMLIAAMLATAKKNQNACRKSYEEELVYNAAMSGIAYARMRLEKTLDEGEIWQGCEEVGGVFTKEYTPKLKASSNFSVVEHHIIDGKGWVEGTFHNSNSKFFIYFIPPPELTFYDKIVGEVTAKYRSVNNTDMFAETENYDFQGKLCRIVPYYTANIIVQGRCGKLEKTIEVMWVKTPDPMFDCVAYSNNKMDITLNALDGKWSILSEREILPPIVRSNKVILVKCLSARITKTDFVQMADGGIGKAKGRIIFKPSHILSPEEVNFIENAGDQSSHIPLLKWADLDYEERRPPIPFAGGTYVFYKDKDNELFIKHSKQYTDPEEGKNPRKWENHYKWADLPSGHIFKKVFLFAEKKDKFKNTLRNKFGNIIYDEIDVKIISPISVEPTRYKVEVEKTTYNPATGVYTTRIFEVNKTHNGIYFWSEGLHELKMTLMGDEENPVYIYNNSNLNNGGDAHIRIDGELRGEGALYAKGDIIFEGRSSLAADTGFICLYSDGKIEMKGFSKIPFEEGKNPNKALAEAVLAYIDSLPSGKKKKFKTVKLDNAAYKIIADIEVTPVDNYSKLGDILTQVFGYSKGAVKGLVFNMVINNKDKIGKGKGEYIFFNSKYPSKFQDIIVNPSSAKAAIRSADQTFKGLVYCRDGFNTTLKEDNLIIQGALISREGKIDIRAGNVVFNYDLRYLGPLYDLGNNSFKQLYWAVY